MQYSHNTELCNLEVTLIHYVFTFFAQDTQKGWIMQQNVQMSY